MQSTTRVPEISTGERSKTDAKRTLESDPSTDLVEPRLMDVKSAEEQNRRFLLAMVAPARPPKGMGA